MCVSLIRQAKKQFFKNLDTKDVNDNKVFWKTVKPFMSDKVQTRSKITLVEKKNKEKSTETFEKIITDDKEIAETFNEFFVNIVPNLKIPTSHNCNTDFEETDDPIYNAINKYKDHPSILMIKSKIDQQSKFSFSQVQYEDVLKKVKNLKVSNASQQSDIPTKILINNSEFFAEYFHENINFCLDKSLLFPGNLKLADVTPANRKKSKTSKDTHRPVSILFNTLIFLKSMKGVFMIKFNFILTKYSLNINVDFVKVIIRNIA